MRRNTIFVLSLALCIVVSQVQTAAATSSLRTSFRSYYGLSSGSTNYDTNCIVCHPGGDTGALNGYGSDLLDEINGGASSTEAYTTIDTWDSDGDGFLNGREVLWYDTLPGDSNSFPLDPVADTASTWGQVKALYR